MAEKKYKCLYPGCEGIFRNPGARKGHLLSHVTEEQLLRLLSENSENSMIEKSQKEGKMTTEKNGEKQPEPDLTKVIGEGFKAVEARLGKVETDVGDFCSKFPELCNRVESIEKGLAGIGEVRVPTIEAGSDEWKGRRKADLDHMLFGDCPECTPIRDEILQAKGKILADVEPKVENDVEAKVEAPELELETSTHPKRGFKWDWNKRLYVKKQEGGGE